jgi:hypothetical protein
MSQFSQGGLKTLCASLAQKQSADLSIILTFMRANTFIQYDRRILVHELCHCRGGMILRVSKVSALGAEAVLSKANKFALVAVNKGFIGS